MPDQLDEVVDWGARLAYCEYHIEIGDHTRAHLYCKEAIAKIAELEAALRGVLAGDHKRIFRVLDLGDIEDLLALEAQNKRLREALRRAYLYVPAPFCYKDDCVSSLCKERRSLHAEIQALLAESQPAATQQPKGGGE